MMGTWLMYIYTHSLTIQNLVVVLCTAMFNAKISAFLAPYYVRIFCVFCKEVKQSGYRPRVAHRVPGS